MDEIPGLEFQSEAYGPYQQGKSKQCTCFSFFIPFPLILPLVLIELTNKQ